MERPSKQDIYSYFIEFVKVEIQRERSVVSRRMLSVVFWCFLLPAATLVVAIILMKMRILPAAIRGSLDWLILAFPVAYSIYFLSFEVLKELPNVFRKGGMSNTLAGAAKDGKWRERVTDDMRRAIKASPHEWRWIISNFKIDLDNLQYRARYLTALAGAVFFLIMRGIDSIVDTPKAVSLIRDPVSGWVDAGGGAGEFSEFVGLGLFLILLYLSGNQTYHSLLRYLHCAELVIKTTEKD